MTPRIGQQSRLMAAAVSDREDPVEGEKAEGLFVAAALPTVEFGDCTRAARRSARPLQSADGSDKEVGGERGGELSDVV